MINNHNIIVLDKTVKGKRYRLSTGIKSDKRNLTWYQNHFDEEFEKLYNKKFGTVLNKSISFKEYGSSIIKITGQNRNDFSQKEEETRLKKLCEYFGDIDILSINASKIALWQSECGLAPKTIRNYRSTLGSIFEMAIYDEIISKNPLKVVKAPESELKEVFVYSIDEMSSLINHAAGQFKNILMFNFFAGLRGSELIALKWSNIDFDEKTIEIKTRVREGIEDVTKSKKVRTLDMLPQMRSALLQQKQITGLSKYVFVTQYGQRYQTPDVLNVSFQKLCKKADVQIGHFHSIRKTCNTMFKQLGLPEDWILDQIGHSRASGKVVNREHYTGRLKPNVEKVGTVLAHLYN